MKYIYIMNLNLIENLSIPLMIIMEHYIRLEM